VLRDPCAHLAILDDGGCQVDTIETALRDQPFGMGAFAGTGASGHQNASATHGIQVRLRRNADRHGSEGSAMR
jgi:hypothetical protein